LLCPHPNWPNPYRLYTQSHSIRCNSTRAGYGSLGQLLAGPFANLSGETAATPAHKDKEIRVRMGNSKLQSPFARRAATRVLSTTFSKKKSLLAPHLGFEDVTHQLTEMREVVCFQRRCLRCQRIHVRRRLLVAFFTRPLPHSMGWKFSVCYLVSLA
jgi:hypothetical protein